MRISDIIDLARPYLLMGMAFASAAAVLILIGYFIVYRKLLKGTKRLNRRSVSLLAIFAVYLIVVLGVTFLSRYDGALSSINRHLFRSYREAWNHYSVYEWRILILNILLFIPFGFLLPFLGGKWHSWWAIYLAGFSFSLLIELTQLVSRRGVVDIDDVFNNTLGAMIGFGLAYVLIHAKSLRTSDGRRHALFPRSVVMAQMPLFLTIAAFGMIFLLYHAQALGNLRDTYAFRVDMSNIHVTTAIEFDDQPGTAFVYRAETGSVERATGVAETMLASVNAKIEPARTNLYDETAVFYSTDGRYSVWVDFVGLTMTFTDFAHRSAAKKPGLSRAEVAGLLDAYTIDVPESAVFHDKGNGDYLIVARLSDQRSDWLDGKIECSVTADSAIFSLRNAMVSCVEHQECSLISERAAYEKLLAGKFRANDAGPMSSFTITGLSLEYRIDTKGYFQPVYAFSVIRTGDTGPAPDSIIIPAIR